MQCQLTSSHPLFQLFKMTSRSLFILWIIFLTIPLLLDKIVICPRLMVSWHHTESIFALILFVSLLSLILQNFCSKCHYFFHFFVFNLVCFFFSTGRLQERLICQKSKYTKKYTGWQHSVRILRGKLNACK